MGSSVGSSVGGGLVGDFVLVEVRDFVRVSVHAGGACD